MRTHSTYHQKGVGSFLSRRPCFSLPHITHLLAFSRLWNSLSGIRTDLSGLPIFTSELSLASCFLLAPLSAGFFEPEAGFSQPVFCGVCTRSVFIFLFIAVWFVASTRLLTLPAVPVHLCPSRTQLALV